MKKQNLFNMLNTFKHFIPFIILALVIIACDDDDDPMEEPPKTLITTVVAEDDRFTTLLAAVDQAGLVSTLSGDGPFTVFAPTNAAFEAYLTAKGITADELLNSPDLKKILQYHVVSGNVRSTDLSNGEVTTLSGPAYVNVNNGVTINGISTVTQADVITENGVIHVIDAVLEPASQSITEIAAGNSNFSTLVSLLQQYDLVDALSGDGPFTVFAPTNEAFEKISDALATKSDAEIADILKFHVVPGRAFSSDLVSQDYPTLNTRRPLSVDLSNGIVVNGTEEVSPANANVFATNGVIHIIDDVLLPKQTVVDVAVYNENFSSLVAALTKAGLVETLDNAENLTVFAPTNDAFAAALQALGFSSLDDVPVEALTPILTYHVLGLDAPALSTDLVDGSFYTTLNGAAIKFDAGNLDLIDANDNMIGLNADLLDLETSNGVVHVINGVLLPPSQNVVEIAVGSDPEFTTLVSLITRVGLQEALSSTEDAFTVFAPTNQAFEDLGIDPSTLTDEQVTDILLYHVLDGKVFSSQITNGLEAETKLADAKFTINVNGNVTITDGNTDSPDATITATDIQGTNGVIHIIDKVILPN
ncbi:fasciclin domain-containing protein [Flexithrix dorotheae]|uniref:fasciclin domain-containing protein n=1 Tax=Flexithrix dorotheae TaxID=70993 RepID=UPI0003A9383F|nr:fasciclin domain-containing protein [Flexithrix dorotheae]